MYICVQHHTASYIICLVCCITILHHYVYIVDMYYVFCSKPYTCISIYIYIYITVIVLYYTVYCFYSESSRVVLVRTSGLGVLEGVTSFLVGLPF